MKEAVGLRQWIKEVGIASVCQLLDVEPYTVMGWVREVNLPMDRMKFKIVRVAKGRVTYQSMIECHAKKNGWK